MYQVWERSRENWKCLFVTAHQCVWIKAATEIPSQEELRVALSLRVVVHFNEWFSLEWFMYVWVGEGWLLMLMMLKAKWEEQRVKFITSKKWKMIENKKKENFHSYYAYTQKNSPKSGKRKPHGEGAERRNLLKDFWSCFDRHV